MLAFSSLSLCQMQQTYVIAARVYDTRPDPILTYPHLHIYFRAHICTRNHTFTLNMRIYAQFTFFTLKRVQINVGPSRDFHKIQRRTQQYYSRAKQPLTAAHTTHHSP